MKSVFLNLTNAGEFRAKSEISVGEKRDYELKRCIEEFEIAAARLAPVSNLTEQSSNLRHHILILLAEAYEKLGNLTQSNQLLGSVISESSNRDTKYLANALYKITARHTDLVEQRQNYQRGIDVSNNINEPMFVAMGQNYLAINLVRDGQYLRAIALLEAAHDKYLLNKNFHRQLSVLHNLSWANQRARNLPKALEFGIKQKLLAERYQDGFEVAWANYNLALGYSELGVWAVAEGFLDDAFELVDQMPKHKGSGIESLKNALLQEKLIGLVRYGITDQALEFSHSVIEIYKKEGYHSRIAEIQSSQLEVYLQLDQRDSARNLLAELIKYHEDNNRRFGLAKNQAKLANLEMLDGNFIQASEYHNSALRYVSSIGDGSTSVQYLVQSVALLNGLGDHDGANRLSKKLERILTQNHSKKVHAQFYLNWSRAATGLGEYKNAKQYFKLALSKVDESLNKVTRRDLKRTYLALQEDIFSHGLSLFLSPEIDDVTGALELAESYRVKTLREAMSLSYDIEVDSMANEKRNNLLQQINENAYEWHKQRGYENRKSQQRSQKLSESLALLESEILDARINRQKSKLESITVSSLAIPDNEVVIYFHLAELRSWMWVLHSSGVSSFALPPKQLIEAQTLDVINRIAIAPQDRGNNEGAYVLNKKIKLLSETLLGPLSEQLAQTSFNHITFVAHGVLNTLPFAVLRAPNSDKPLIDQYVVTNTPSLAIRSYLSSTIDTNNSDQSMLVVGRSYYGKELGLSDLPYSLEEATYIRSLAKPDAVDFIDESASKKDYLNNLDNDYSLIHLGAHGVLNNEQPNFSGIVFAENESELLLVPEIAANPIRADLVVLSACETSVGKIVAGEGALSLSRAFLEAGAKRVMGTLWKVQDFASFHLIKSFYSKLLNDNLSTGAALRSAQLSIYNNPDNDWSDPYYWAAYQIQGGGAQ